MQLLPNLIMANPLLTLCQGLFLKLISSFSLDYYSQLPRSNLKQEKVSQVTRGFTATML